MLLVMSIFASCSTDNCYDTYIEYTPVFVSMEKVRQAPQMVAPQEMDISGKIYIYQPYLFINEPDKGVHIYDNTDPSSPINLGFLEIPGNVDIAVRGKYLYADNYIDLVVFDLSNPENPKFINRLENVFPIFYYEDPVQGLLVRYDEKEVTQKVSCDVIIERRRWQAEVDGNIGFGRPLMANASADASRAQATTGIGGSLARFTILDDHMFAVDEFSLKVFDLSIPDNPDFSNEVQLGWGIETIFPYGDKLFIGSNNAMFIYDASTPSNPQMLSTFWHANSCDPIYVDNNIAFITLRDGTTCRNGLNQLEVLDVSDLESPKLLEIYPMHHPIGLSVNNGNLFICEDDQGLKVFDTKDLLNIDKNLLSHNKGFTAHDIITYGNIGIVIGKDGLVQYDISDPKKLKVLSTIAVNQ